MFLALQGSDLEPVVKNIPAIIKEASQSQRGIFALLIIVLFALALYFFRTAAVKWRVLIFLVLFGGVVAYGWEINRVASKPVAMHYTGRVLDKGTTTPIHEATVTVSLSGKKVPPYLSDSDGNFSFWLARKNATEDANVKVEHVDYQEYDRNVSSDSDARLGDIRLVRIGLADAASPASLTGDSAAAAEARAPEKKQDMAKRRLPVGVLVLPPPPPSVSASRPALEQRASALPPRPAESSSGRKLSGKGSDWSPWYEVSVGPAPDGYTVDKVDFWLTGDRSCGAWAECKPMSKDDTKVVWSFRMQGHDEWGAPPQAYSEGHLRVTYRLK